MTEQYLVIASTTHNQASGKSHLFFEQKMKNGYLKHGPQVILSLSALQSNSLLAHAEKHSITRQSSSTFWPVRLCKFTDMQSHARAIA
jgi:hypothetical protein